MKLKILILSSLLTGCATVSTGVKISVDDWESLSVGVTTKTQVVTMFGHPLVSGNNEVSPGTGEWKLCGSQGAIVDTLMYTSQRATSSPFSVDSSTNTYTFRFNKQGLLCLKTKNMM